MSQEELQLGTHVDSASEIALAIRAVPVTNTTRTCNTLLMYTCRCRRR